MRLKTLGIAGLVLAVGVFAWTLGHAQQSHAASSPIPAGQNGRYQVIPATIDFSGLGGGTARKQTVIRIDTQTGKVWELFETSISGADSFGSSWVPLNESYQQPK